MNKKIETILLSENDVRLEKINDFFEENFEKTIKEMFVILLNSIKHRAISDINIILSNIEKIVLMQDSKNYKIINSVVCDTNNKMQEIKKKTNNNEFKNIRFRLIDLNRKMKEMKDETSSRYLYNFYHYLIFEEKNLEMIELIFNNENSFLDKKDEFDNNLLYNIIDYYCSLLHKEQKEEIDYFYEVIILILKNEESKLVKSDKQVYLDLLNRKFCKNKEHVKEVIERFYDFYSIDLNSLEKKYNIFSKVSPSVLEETKKFRLTNENREYIDANFITIDEEGALVLDDAISLKENPDGSFNYYIAITDVASFIPYGSLTFYDAMKKIETIYLSDRVINMYPEETITNLCSLLPNETRNAIVYKVLVDPDFYIDYDSLEIIPGIIKVQNRLTYSQVNKKNNIDDETARMLEKLAYLSFNLKKENKAKEKYRKIENIINSDAIHHHSMFTEVSISANIVQESMLLVNYLAGKYFDNNNLVYIFRNLNIPDNRMISKELEELLKEMSLDTDGVDYNRILNLLKEFVLTAHYSTENEGHQGLNYSHYSHSTSAARRFADSFNQYLTHEQVFNDITDKKYYELEMTTKEVVNHINLKKKENSKFESEYNYLNSKKLIRKR